jgi:hypothetical protein
LADVGFLSRLLLLAGSAGLALSALLPWVTIKGLSLDLSFIGVQITPGAATVNGTDTTYWPYILGVAAAVAILGVIGVARRLLLVVGVAVTAAGGGLLYYCSNVIDLETKGEDELVRTLADAALSSSVGPGPAVMIASGLLIVAGAAIAR